MGVSNLSPRRQRHTRRPAARVGAAVVEFAFVAPLLITLTFGMIEIGRVVMVKQLLINAAREGARMAILPASISQDVIAHVQDELNKSSIQGATVTLSPESLANAPAGSAVTVAISINASAVSWLPKPLFVVSQQLDAATTMRRESL